MTAQAPIKQKGKKARRAKKAQSIAAAADVWQDRDGKARPTPERRAKGAFVLRDTEDAGVTCAVDEGATTLDRLNLRGIINRDQCQGGHDFAALMERTRMVSSGRSCLDFSPVGFDSGNGNEWQEERDSRDRSELYLACGMLTWAELRRVCCEGQPPRSVERLKAGLDLCARFWQ